MTRALLVLLGACSVPPVSLAGKQCPCTDGYVCDDLTNRCLATNDGGTIIDSPAATQCLPSAAGETEVYRYGGAFGWTATSGSWSGTANEIVQSSTSAQDSYAYPTDASLANAADVRVLATMRPVNTGSGRPHLGIVLRAPSDPQMKDRYACTWSNDDRVLRIERYSGGSPTLLADATVGGIPPASLTMEAAVTGDALSCCIRELGAMARVTATDASITGGYPGLQTNRMEAAFGSFVVFRP